MHFDLMNFDSRDKISKSKQVSKIPFMTSSINVYKILKYCDHNNGILEIFFTETLNQNQCFIISAISFSTKMIGEFLFPKSSLSFGRWAIGQYSQDFSDFSTKGALNISNIFTMFECSPIKLWSSWNC